MPQWPPPPQVIFVLSLMALVLLAGISYGLLSLARFLAFRRAGVNPFEDGDDDMSSDEGIEDGQKWSDYVAATTATTQQQPIATPATDNNALLFQQQVEDAASMVEAGVCGETKALQIIFKVRPSSTNPRYLAARDALHAELEKRKGAPTPIAGRISKAQFPG